MEIVVQCKSRPLFVVLIALFAVTTNTIGCKVQFELMAIFVYFSFYVCHIQMCHEFIIEGRSRFEFNPSDFFSLNISIQILFLCWDNKKEKMNGSNEALYRHPDELDTFLIRFIFFFLSAIWLLSLPLLAGLFV